MCAVFHLDDWLDSLVRLPLSLRQRDLLGDLLETVLVLAAVFAMRLASLTFVRRSRRLSEPLRLRLYVLIRRVSFVLLLLGLALVWTRQLQNLALSLVAIAVAIAIATKELILCLLGTFLRTAAGSFGVGDRIAISHWHGDVVDQTLLATTILEVDEAYQRTGRVVVFPNSLLLSHPVQNESYYDGYILHSIVVPLLRSEDWRAAQSELLSAANAVCGAWLAKGPVMRRELETLHGLSVPPPVPQVTVRLPDAESLELVLRVPTQAGDKGRVEQQILQYFLDHRTSVPVAAP